MNFLKIKSKYLFIFFSITISFGQNIETILPTLEIDTLLNNGSKNNRINIAFSNVTSPSGNEVYQSKSHLKEDINEILTYFNAQHSHAKSGFSNYQSFFNVFSVWFPDPLIFESKPEYYEKAQGIRDALFLPWVDDEYGWITMMYVFDGGGGGGAGNVREKRVGDALIYGLDWETVLHEFNHTMPGLYDEYTASGAWSNYECVEGPNVTGQNVIDEVPWRKWLDQDIAIPTPYESTYFNKVGLFEGNISGYFGCYRPTAKSCYMGAGGFSEGFGDDMCNVCLQRFVTMLYKYVNVIENPMPASTQIEINGSETITFSADIIKPEPNTQKYEWFVNEQLFSTGQESININFDACDNYVVDLVVTDTTDAVRYDEKFKDIYPEPKQKHTWYVNQSAVSSYNLSIETIIKPADCNGIENGEIVVTTSGGLGPYKYILNGKLQDSSHFSNLSVGSYNLVVSDANGCSIINEIEITQDQLLDFEICSSYIQDSWGLSASLFTDDNGELTYLWSNGSTDPSILVEVNGIYNLEITNATGCVVQREISISEVSEVFEVTHTYANTVSNLNNGAIYLELNGGLAPYEIIWYKFNTQDKTLPLDNQVIASDISPWTPKVYAFNNNQGASEDFWAEEFTGSNYIGYDFGKATTIEYYSLTANVDTKERDAKSWIFQGSDDGDNWTDIEHINDIEFAERLQKIDFNLGAPVSFRFFRLKFSENWGSDRIVVQEFEFGAYVEEEIKQNKDKRDIQGLAPGNYSYKVTDLNNSCFEDKIEISNMESPTLNAIVVVQDGVYQVKIENPNSDLSYYWTEDNTGSNILHIGTDFRPPSMGTYYVRPFINSISALGEEIKGFTVTMTNSPLIENKDGKIRILNPEENHSYYWYNELKGGEAVHTGIEFIPNSEGVYFVSAMEISEEITPIDPSTIEGVKLWMDASDLDGNGIIDHGIESSSAYSWKFREGGKWGDDSWFPYRGNFQNGLGIVDFSTMWFQYLSTNVQQMRTVILAYQESSFSFDKTAPLHGLNENIPKHSDASQLFSNDAPSTTLNGKTFLNGERVDPLTQNNPMDFIVLSVVFSDLINASPYASHENWEGKLGELIVWDIALSDDQIKGVNEFLRKKWLSIADLESNRVGVTWGEDSDSDGVMNDVDACHETPLGEEVDVNGCSESQKDDDNDGVMNDVDTCPGTSSGEEVEANGCSESQLDDDNDGIMNDVDLCANTPSGESVDANGCTLLAFNNFTIETISETCPDKNNGKISIEAQASYNYKATINGANYDFTTNKTIENLAPGSYELCIVVTDQTSPYCFNVEIKEGTTISAKSSTTKNKTTVEIIEGTAPYDVFVNGNVLFKTLSSTFDVDVQHGDLIEVKTAVSCEGVYSKTLQLFNVITLYPNPTDGIFEVLVPLNLKEAPIEIYNSNSQLINSKTYPVVSGKVQLDLRNQTSGVYLVKILVQEHVTLKVVKK